MSARKTIRIDVFSDFTCGWCYFAHRELEQGVALARAANLPADFRIQYHPYILHAAVPEEPVSRADYYGKKVGAERWTAIEEMVKRRAEQEGVNFNLDSPVSSTLRAHRLMQHAWTVGGQAAQQALVTALLRAVFEESKNINDVDLLADIALSISTPPDADDQITTPLFENLDAARAWLRSDALAAQVRAASADAARRGVAGVPCAVIDGRWALAGCQAPTCYFKVFEKIATGHCSGTCPSLSKGGTAGTKAGPTMLKADAVTICGAGNTMASAVDNTSDEETVCTPSLATHAQAQQLTKQNEVDVPIPRNNLAAVAPTAVAI